MPGDEECEFSGLVWPQRVVNGQRGFWCRDRRGSVFKLSVVTEVIPEIKNRCSPACIQPCSPVRNPLRGRCGKSHRAPSLVVSLHTVGCHENTLNAMGVAKFILVMGCDTLHAVIADEVLHRSAYRDVERLSRSVF